MSFVDVYCRDVRLNIIYLFSLILFLVLSTKATKPSINCTMLTPVVHTLGDESACIAYILLLQFIDRYELSFLIFWISIYIYIYLRNGQPQSVRTEETRVWHKKDSRWLCIHFHRSGMPAASAIKSSYSVTSM
jgi:calcium/calmodulin-dependent protein kinase (CaM kinase) II